MLSILLENTNIKTKTKIGIKTIIATIFIALAVILPQLVHLIAQANGGMMWLPMYYPVLLAGGLLGIKWGLGIGILSPLVSFAITSIFHQPMPMLERLPFMMIELSVFAVVAGAFSKLIFKNQWMILVALIAAQIAGRCSFLCSVFLLQSQINLTFETALPQVLMSGVGLLVQWVILSVAMILIRKKIIKENNRLTNC